MFTIYEDDYAQTASPALDSDGAVELYWDHPDYPNRWSGRYCTKYPYENWSKIGPLRERWGEWDPYAIILGHFNLYEYKHDISSLELDFLNPEQLRKLEEEKDKQRKSETTRQVTYSDNLPLFTIYSRPLSVFLCHSSGDKLTVRELYHRLTDDKIDPWLDEEKLLPVRSQDIDNSFIS